MWLMYLCKVHNIIALMSYVPQGAIFESYNFCKSAKNYVCKVFIEHCRCIVFSHIATYIVMLAFSLGELENLVAVR